MRSMRSVGKVRLDDGKHNISDRASQGLRRRDFGAASQARSQTRSAAFAEAARGTTRGPSSTQEYSIRGGILQLFFSGARPYVRAVAQLQEGLGAFNDEASAPHLLWDIEAAAGPQAAKAAGIVLGWCERGTVIADDNLRKSWKSFRRSRPFWRRANCLVQAGSHVLRKRAESETLGARRRRSFSSSLRKNREILGFAVPVWSFVLVVQSFGSA